MAKITQEKKVIQYLQECFKKKREITHRKIARDTNVSIYLVQKVVRRLRRAHMHEGGFPFPQRRI